MSVFDGLEVGGDEWCEVYSRHPCRARYPGGRSSEVLLVKVTVKLYGIGRGDNRRQVSNAHNRRNAAV